MFVDRLSQKDAPYNLLTVRGHITSDALARARRLAVEANESLAATLTQLGLVSEIDLAEAFSAALQLPFVNSLPSDISLPAEISATFLRNARVLPLSQASEESDGGMVRLAMADPLATAYTDPIRDHTRDLTLRRSSAAEASKGPPDAAAISGGPFEAR